MSDIQELTDEINRFFHERDWKQFHNPKDMAITLLLEAAEVLEHFQWKSEQEIQEHLRINHVEVQDEIADVMVNVLALAHDLNIDLKQAVLTKLQKNRHKYPIEKSKGRHTKYTQF